VRFRVCSFSRSFGNVGLFNLRPGGALTWKVETVDCKGRGVVRRKSAPSGL
jgi:hypothetical protein